MRPDVIPQLADGAEVLERIDVPDDVSLSVLIPNERGLDNALGLRERFDEVNVFLSASETHNRANVNRSVEESLTGLERCSAARGREGTALRGRDLGRLRLPLRGPRPARAGVRDRAAADRRGRAGDRLRRHDRHGEPGAGARVLPGRARGARREVELTAHFHNTRGQGLANVLAALDAGVRSFESSFGELGGCPVPRGATGNIATEDLVSMLHEMGVETGVSLERLLEAARAVQEVLGRPLGSHVLTAGPVVWNSPS